VTDDADELDRRLARLFEEGRRREDPEDHPSPEKLSAYQANELPPEEADEIQEHLTECRLCTEILLDFQRFLEPEEEDRSQEGVADFGAEAGWRELRGKMEWKRESESRDTPGAEMSRLKKSLRSFQAVAAVLLAGVIGLSVWNVNLSKKSHEPRSISILRTFEAEESLRGAERLPEPPLVLPMQIILSLPTETPNQVYRVDLVREGKRQPEHSLEVPVQGTELSLFLPEKSLQPGRYIAHAVGLRKTQPSLSVWTYRLTIGAPSP
jgi:hypothetical protein